MKTISNIPQNFKQLEKSIRNYFIKSLSNGYECNDMERELFELAAKYGGLAIINPSKTSAREYHNSRILTQEGSQLIKNHHLIYNVSKNKLKEIKNVIKCEKPKQYQGSLTKIKQALQNDRSRLKLLESTCNILLMEYDFYFKKTTFWDSIRICYDILLKYLPSRCGCGQIFKLEHALSCKKEGFITMNSEILQQPSYQ